MVIKQVRAPKREAAWAASQPACPPPITITSYEKTITKIINYAKGLYEPLKVLRTLKAFDTKDINCQLSIVNYKRPLTPINSTETPIPQRSYDNY
jgi:hypothetical protein